MNHFTSQSLAPTCGYLDRPLFGVREGEPEDDDEAGDDLPSDRLLMCLRPARCDGRVTVFGVVGVNPLGSVMARAMGCLDFCGTSHAVTGLTVVSRMVLTSVGLVGAGPSPAGCFACAAAAPARAGLPSLLLGLEAKPGKWTRLRVRSSGAAAK